MQDAWARRPRGPRHARSLRRRYLHSHEVAIPSASQGHGAGGGRVFFVTDGSADDRIGRGRFGDSIRLREAAGASIPSIGEIGLNQFATYLMNRVVAT